MFRPRERRDPLHRLERTSEDLLSDYATAQVFAILSILVLFPY
jgi:hypothetical protein